MKGLILFLVLGVIIIAVLYYFRKTGASNARDRSAWHISERTAFEALDDRLKSGDLTQEEYEAKKREIENQL